VAAVNDGVDPPAAKPEDALPEPLLCCDEVLMSLTLVQIFPFQDSVFDIKAILGFSPPNANRDV
jgi:hypothetical protein